MPIEGKRGCGFRKLYKMYLVGEGISVPCDRLPFELAPCRCCGYAPPFSRGFSWINSEYLGEHEECTCIPFCPICHPNTVPPDKTNQGKYGLMWVGQRYYSPKSFVREARDMGVSKAIGSIPKDLVLGKTWVLLAHKKVPIYDEGLLEENGLARKEPRHAPAIFYAFTPQRVEMLLPESECTPEKVEELAEQGITVVPVPQSQLEDHR